jgi:hypothetical protein
MPISLACPKCQKRLRIKDELAGKRVRCPGCGSLLPVPAPAEPAPAPPPTVPVAPQAQEPVLVLAAPAELDGGSVSPQSLPGRRCLWPWLAAGGGGLALVLMIVLVVVLASGGGGDTQVIRARRVLINASRGERLTPNFPDRDVVVVLKLTSDQASARGSRLLTSSYVLAGGQRRPFQFMSIPNDPSRPIWAAAIIPLAARKVTVHLGDAPPQSLDLPEAVVDEANAFD